MSSSVDQTTCFRPAVLAACAIAAAWAISFSGEKWSQKNVTQNAPCAPPNAFARLAASSTFAATTSAPAAARARPFSLFGSRVIARTANSPFGSARMARTRPPPWAPVAPDTAMIFLAMATSRGLGRGRRRTDRVRRLPTRVQRRARAIRPGRDRGRGASVRPARDSPERSAGEGLAESWGRRGRGLARRRAAPTATTPPRLACPTCGKMRMEGESMRRNGVGWWCWPWRGSPQSLDGARSRRRTGLQAKRRGVAGAEPVVTSSTGLAANPQALPPPAGRPERAGSPPAALPVRESRIGAR